MINIRIINNKNQINYLSLKLILLQGRIHFIWCFLPSRIYFRNWIDIHNWIVILNNVDSCIETFYLGYLNCIGINYVSDTFQGVPEVTDSFNLLIKRKIWTLGCWNLSLMKEYNFHGLLPLGFEYNVIGMTARVVMTTKW